MPLINVRKRKHELRARFKRFRAECPPELKKSLDKRLFERFASLEEYLAADVLFAYISQPIECDTSAIIADALEKGKRVAVPKCHKTSKAVDFSCGLCLVPGLSFDLQGYRLGFGKGYYDRFLSDFGGTTVGICYSKCTMGELPRGTFDRAVDIVLTEKFSNRTGG